MDVDESIMLIVLKHRVLLPLPICDDVVQSLRYCPYHISELFIHFNNVLIGSSKSLYGLPTAYPMCITPLPFCSW